MAKGTPRGSDTEIPQEEIIEFAGQAAVDDTVAKAGPKQESKPAEPLAEKVVAGSGVGDILKSPDRPRTREAGA